MKITCYQLIYNIVRVMKIPGYLMIYNLKLFLLLILYQFIDDLVAWVYIYIYFNKVYVSNYLKINKNVYLIPKLLTTG